MKRWWIWFRCLRRGDKLAVAIAFAVIAGVAALAFTGYWGLAGMAWQGNFGFGPRWHCTFPGKGEPVCVKDVGTPPAKPAH